MKFYVEQLSTKLYDLHFTIGDKSFKARVDKTNARKTLDDAAAFFGELAMDELAANAIKGVSQLCEVLSEVLGVNKPHDQREGER